MDYTKYKNWLEANLTKERFQHSLGTAECAVKLAEKFNLDKEKAQLCGLVHDCAKCIPNEELKSLICNLSDLCEGELINPKTYHAPAGAIIAKKELNITDEEILSAIRWHTLGKINMTDFEKIIFLADKIEERTRPYEIINPIKKVLDEENGLDKALLICYGNTIKSLVDRNLKICKITVDIYNELLKELDLKSRK
jgi:predicted HD superfamily hydrolase involved in NAD metabolism